MCSSKIWRRSRSKIALSSDPANPAPELTPSTRAPRSPRRPPRGTCSSSLPHRVAPCRCSIRTRPATLWHATAAVSANARPRQDATAPRPHLQRPDGAVHPCTPASPAAPACKHARQVASPIRQWCPPWPVHPAAAYQRPSNPPASPTSSSRL